MLSKSKTFSHSHSHSHRRYLQIDRRVRDQERKTHENGHFIGLKYTENIFWSRYAKWGAKYWFLFSLSHSEFPFFPSFVEMFSLAPKRARTFKIESRKWLFRRFHIPKHTFTLMKRISGRSLKHSECNNNEANIWTRWNVRGHESVSRGTRIRCLARWCYCCSFSLCFAFSIEKFRKKEKKISGISHQKLHSLWSLPSVADTLISMMADHFLEWIFQFWMIQQLCVRKICKHKRNELNSVYCRKIEIQKLELNWLSYE